MSGTGVQVSVTALAGTGNGDDTREAQLFLVGITSRGATDAPIIARSYPELVDLTGPRTLAGAAHDAARAYFASNAGTGRVVLARATGPGVLTTGTVTVKDRAAAPLDTISLNASSVGSWSSAVSVVVTNGPAPATVNLAVRLDGKVIETFAGLATPAAIAQALLLSQYVRAVNLGSASDPTATPGINLPAVGTYTLSAGNADTANITTTELIAALTRFTPEYGPGLVAIPGQPISLVGPALAAHGASFGRIAIGAAPAGTTVQGAITAARALRTVPGSRALGMVYPWVTIPADGEAGARLVSPEGIYAGKRAAAIAAVGVWQPPAGDFGVIDYSTGPERSLTGPDIDALVDEAIIPIAPTPTARIYGDRSLSADEVTWRFLSYSDEVNAIAFDARGVMDAFVGRPIDGLSGQFFASMLTALIGVLQPYAVAGGLVPGNGDPGYVISFSANTAASVSTGVAIADIAVRPPSVAELIRIRLTKTGIVPAAA